MNTFFRKHILYYFVLFFLFEILSGNETKAQSSTSSVKNLNTPNSANNTSSCSVDSLNISTGWNYNTNSTYNNLNNDQDVFWRLVGAPGSVNLNGPAWVINKNSIWSNPVPGSQWISAFDTANPNQSYNPTPFAFQMKIVVTSTTNLTFNLKVLVDNYADIKFVDSGGNLISPIGSLQSSPFFYGNYFTSDTSIVTTVNNVAAGTYYLRLEMNNDNFAGATGIDVEGFVKGASNSLNVPSCLSTTLSSLSGFKWHDLNNNGIREAEEEYLSGWQIDLNGNGISKSAKTDVNGYYVFNDLPAGTYTVSEVAQGGWTAGPTGVLHTIVLGTNVAIAHVNFGNKKTTGSICGIKFNDINGNGIKDPNEGGLQNWVINLKYQNAAGYTNLYDTTDGKGNFCFDNLQPGVTYTISEINQSGWTQTYPAVPGTYSITLASGQNIDTLKFGNHNSSVNTDSCSADSLNISTGWNYNTDSTYNNLNSDQDVFWTLVKAPTNNGPVNVNGPAWVIEKYTTGWSDPIAGSQWISAFNTYGSNLANTAASDTPYVFQKSICVNSATILTYNLNVLVDNYVTIKFVDANGNSLSQIGVLDSSQVHYFSNPHNFTGTINIVTPGTYYLRLELRNDNPGSAMGIDVQGSIKGVASSLINKLCCGTNGSSITGYKFNDQNNNGIKDPGEQVLSGWQINLSGVGISQSSTTDANGNYLFTGLSAGTYTISETAQPGWVAGPTGAQHTITIGTNQAINNIKFGNRISTSGSICDSLKATASKITPGDCNWSLSLIQPANLSGVFGIQITCLSPNQFTTGTGLGTNFQNWFTSSNTYYPPTGHVPGGNLNDFFHMNINYTTSPQVIVVSWLDSLGNKVCSDTLKLDCQISCTTLISDTVTCNGNGYNFSYKFTNNATYSISNIEYTLQDPSGVTISPLADTLSPALAANATSSAQNIHISGGIPGDTVVIVAKFISSGGCCWCFETFNVILPSCASVCDSLGVSASGSSADCCYSISLTNNSSTVFSNVEFQLISGGMYSTVATTSAPGWAFTNISPNNLINLVKLPFGQGIGHGSFNNVLDMCIRHYYVADQVIAVKWIKDGVVVCTDTLKFQCTPTVLPTDTCSQVIDGAMTCLQNGTVQYVFRVQNNSIINSTGFGIFPTTPGVSFSKTIFNNTIILPGQVSPIDTIIISGIGPNHQVCLQTSIFVTVDSLYNYCCHSDTVCLTAPNCSTKDSAEACITWGLFSDQSVTSVIGNINGTPESIGVGSSSPFMSIFLPYISTGQRLWVGNTGWITGPLDTMRYIEFDASPNPGNNFTVTNVSFNYGDLPLGTDFNIINFKAYYSIDGWINSTVLNATALVYKNTAVLSLNQTISVSVPNGKTFSLRIYPYAIQNSIAMTPTFAIHNNVMICGTTNIVTSIDDGKTARVIPKSFQLQQNYPNPFNPSSVIQYDIPKTSFVKISVYDILGREIRVLVNENKSPGHYEIIFDANGLTSGVYFYIIRTGEFTQIKKMILMK